MRNKIEILKMIHTSMNNGIRSGKSILARDWLKDRSLSIELTQACYNSGQIHHRKSDAYIEELLSVGFLTKSDAPTTTGKKGHGCFAKDSIVFPLRDKNGDVVNFYGIRIQTVSEITGYLNQEGIYPAYPPKQTTILYITKNIMDAASLMESKQLENRDAVMALFDGELKPQHIEAIKELTQLKEIIFIH